MNKLITEQPTDTFVFYRSFYDAIKGLPEQTRGKVYDAMMASIFEEDVAPSDDPIVAGFLMLMLPLIEASQKRHKKAVQNGRKGGEMGARGGRPSAKNASDETPSETPNETPSVTPSITPSITPSVTPSVTPKKPLEGEQQNPLNVYVNVDNNVNDNVNDNVNVNVNNNEKSLSVLSAKEKESFKEIFCFEKNMIDPSGEVERFVNHYEATNWSRNGHPIENRLALARTWEEKAEYRSQDRKCSTEFLARWRFIYDTVKESNPSIASLFISGLKTGRYYPAESNETKPIIELSMTQGLKKMFHECWNGFLNDKYVEKYGDIIFKIRK